MVNSSFYADGETYDTAVVESNDHPGAASPSQAPSGFYPAGNIYDYLSTESEVVALLQALAATTTANASSASASASSAATSATNAAAAVQSAAGTAAPIVDGTAAVGTSTKWAHEDHRHPTDTSRAPLNSPALTGTPTAPTATVGTNTTQVATTAFVLANVSSVPPATSTPLVDGTAAVGVATKYAREDHIHPTDTSRAPLASPVFTGTPAAPTPSAGDSSTKLATTAFVSGTIRGVKKQVFTTSGTYTPSAGLIAAVIECVGGGGGGGGSAISAAVGQYSGGGGGGGGYSRTYATAAAIGAAQTVTVGAAGVGGVGSNNGSNGGTTSVGALCVANGGQGGLYGAVGQFGVGGAGAAVGTGDVTAGGGGSSSGTWSNIAPTSHSFIGSGTGGSSAFGGGGKGVLNGTGGGGSTNGTAGVGYGGAGSGGVSQQVSSGTTAATGGNATAGITIITEYCSQ